MKLIDFENHFYDQCLIDALESRTCLLYTSDAADE